MGSGNQVTKLIYAEIRFRFKKKCLETFFEVPVYLSVYLKALNAMIIMLFLCVTIALLTLN